MPLNPAKLHMLRDLPNGRQQAQCPACAAQGGDKSGNHLRIWPDGRFGCAVHPGNSDHRKEIHAIAGAERKPRPIEVRTVVVVRGPVATLNLSKLSAIMPSQPTTTTEPENPY